MSHSPARVVRNATCTFCGCLCDDIHLTVEAGPDGERIAQAENLCALGQTGFAEYAHPQQPVAPVAAMQGREVQLAEAIDAAAQILAAARSPLIYGLSGTTCEAQQQAVALADLMGAGIDTPSLGMARNAFLNAGESGATLGEIRNRADLIVYWGSNPVVSQPRHLSRHILPPGLLIPNGRRDRTVVVIDVRRTATADAADVFVPIKPGSDFELIWALRALLKGKPIGASIEAETGVPLATLQDLVARMKQCRYGVIFYGPGLTRTLGQHFNTSALQALTVELNDHTHFVARAMRAGGNLAGADTVLTWQTGFPQAVNFSRGFPRFNPGEFSAAEVLARGEADAALIVADDPAAHLPEAALARLSQIPHIVLSSKPTPFSATASVAFNTATYGVHTAGTVYRSDGVSLTLRPALTSPYPSDESILLAIQAQILDVRQRKVTV